MKRTWARAAAIGALIASLILAGAARAGDEPVLRELDAGEVAAARVGSILRIWPQIGGSVEHARAFRILYRSTGLNGEPIVVSGAVFVPDGPPPHGKRDIIAWAHPTTGVVGRCAPTKLANLSGTVSGLEEMLRRGFVVTATDYPGLGVDGIHPYLVGISEARSVLDSVRAARELAGAAASNRFAVWGHSQGGHAALFTGEEAPRYAPELQLVGVAAAAPPTDLVAVFKADERAQSGSGLTAMALLAWSEVYHIPLDTMLARGTRATFDAVATSCIQSVEELLTLKQLEKPLKYRFLKGDPTTTAPWRDLMETNSTGGSPIGVPVFITQGVADDVVHPRHHAEVRPSALPIGHTRLPEAAEAHRARLRRIRQRRRRRRLDADRFDGRSPPQRLPPRSRRGAIPA
ncbi:MAG: lipase family protein [Hyphomicrobium sp.]